MSNNKRAQGVFNHLKETISELHDKGRFVDAKNVVSLSAAVVSNELSNKQVKALTELNEMVSPEMLNVLIGHVKERNRLGKNKAK